MWKGKERVSKRRADVQRSTLGIAPASTGQQVMGRSWDASLLGPCKT